MLTKEVIEQKVNELRDELTAQLEAQETVKLWEPEEEDDEAFYATTLGRITSDACWNNERAKDIIARGLVFRTSEEVKNALQLQRATYRLKKAFYEVCKGENGFIRGKDNVYILNKFDEFEVFSTYDEFSRPSWMYCRTILQAEMIIHRYADDLNTWLNQQ